MTSGCLLMACSFLVQDLLIKVLDLLVDSERYIVVVVVFVFVVVV